MVAWALIFFEACCCFQFFQHIKNDWAGAIVHHHAEQAAGKIVLVQVGEFTAVCKPVFVNAAFSALQKMAGDFVQQHIAAFPFFNVFCFCFSY